MFVCPRVACTSCSSPPASSSCDQRHWTRTAPRRVCISDSSSPTSNPATSSVQGWRYQLSLFANLVANEVHAGAADVVDAWFAAWSEPDAEAREAVLARVVSHAGSSAANSFVRTETGLPT